MFKGYIYILVNPAFKGMIKIGKTNRNPDKRAAELSNATNIPFNYEVGYEKLVSDCDFAEKLIHKKLSEHRVRDNREFFSINLREGINIVNKIIIEEGLSLDEDETWHYSFDDKKFSDFKGLVNSFMRNHHTFENATQHLSKGFLEEWLENQKEYDKLISLKRIKERYKDRSDKAIAELFYTYYEWMDFMFCGIKLTPEYLIEISYKDRKAQTQTELYISKLCNNGKLEEYFNIYSRATNIVDGAFKVLFDVLKEKKISELPKKQLKRVINWYKNPEQYYIQPSTENRLGIHEKSQIMTKNEIDSIEEIFYLPYKTIKLLKSNGYYQYSKGKLQLEKLKKFKKAGALRLSENELNKILKLEEEDFVKRMEFEYARVFPPEKLNRFLLPPALVKGLQSSNLSLSKLCYNIINLLVQNDEFDAEDYRKLKQQYFDSESFTSERVEPIALFHDQEDEHYDTYWRRNDKNELIHLVEKSNKEIKHSDFFFRGTKQQVTNYFKLFNEVEKYMTLLELYFDSSNFLKNHEDIDGFSEIIYHGSNWKSFIVRNGSLFIKNKDYELIKRVSTNYIWSNDTEPKLPKLPINDTLTFLEAFKKGAALRRTFLNNVILPKKIKAQFEYGKNTIDVSLWPFLVTTKTEAEEVILPDFISDKLFSDDEKIAREGTVLFWKFRRDFKLLNKKNGDYLAKKYPLFKNIHSELKRLGQKEYEKFISILHHKGIIPLISYRFISNDYNSYPYKNGQRIAEKISRKSSLSSDKPGLALFIDGITVHSASIFSETTVNFDAPNERLRLYEAYQPESWNKYISALKYSCAEIETKKLINLCKHWCLVTDRDSTDFIRQKQIEVYIEKWGEEALNEIFNEYNIYIDYIQVEALIRRTIVISKINKLKECYTFLLKVNRIKQPILLFCENMLSCYSDSSKEFKEFTQKEAFFIDDLYNLLKPKMEKNIHKTGFFLTWKIQKLIKQCDGSMAITSYH